MLNIIFDTKIYENIRISDTTPNCVSTSTWLCVTSNMKNSTQNVTNVIFRFETSPNTNSKRIKWGDMAYYVPPSKKVGGHGGRVPHQIAPMGGGTVFKVGGHKCTSKQT